MKKSTLIGLLILGLIFHNCKNEKTQEILTNTPIETETVVKQELDTTSVINEELQAESEISSTNELEEINNENTKIEEPTTTTIETPKPTEKEVIKVVEEANETIIKEEINVVEKEIEEEVEKVVETEKTIEKEVEIIEEPETIVKEEVESVIEPVVEKATEEVLVETNTWVVPAKYKKMTNPEDASKENLSIGKNLYSKHCKSCHGKEGYGDGPKADEVEGDLGDFTSNKFKAQSDGALFYKSYIGRDDMPNYEKKMSEEDAWLVVHYMKTL